MAKSVRQMTATGGRVGPSARGGMRGCGDSMSFHSAARVSGCGRGAESNRPRTELRPPRPRLRPDSTPSRTAWTARWPSGTRHHDSATLYLFKHCIVVCDVWGIPPNWFKLPQQEKLFAKKKLRHGYLIGICYGLFKTKTFN